MMMMKMHVDVMFTIGQISSYNTLDGTIMEHAINNHDKDYIN